MEANNFRGRVILGIIGGVFFAISLTFGFLLPLLKSKELYLKSEFSGTVHKIEIRGGNRNGTSILLDSTWHLLTPYEDKILKTIEVGDSLVKKRGKEFFIFRRVKGKYELFKTIR